MTFSFREPRGEQADEEGPLVEVPGGQLWAYAPATYSHADVSKYSADIYVFEPATALP